MCACNFICIIVYLHVFTLCMNQKGEKNEASVKKGKILFKDKVVIVKTNVKIWKWWGKERKKHEVAHPLGLHFFSQKAAAWQNICARKISTIWINNDKTEYVKYWTILVALHFEIFPGADKSTQGEERWMNVKPGREK